MAAAGEKIAPNALSFNARSWTKYITLAIKTMKNAAYAKIKSVVWIGNNHVAENEAGVSLERLPISNAKKVSAEISGIINAPTASVR